MHWRDINFGFRFQMSYVSLFASNHVQKGNASSIIQKKFAHKQTFILSNWLDNDFKRFFLQSCHISSEKMKKTSESITRHFKLFIEPKISQQSWQASFFFTTWQEVCRLLHSQRSRIELLRHHHRRRRRVVRAHRATKLGRLNILSQKSEENIFSEKSWIYCNAVLK